MNGIITHFRRLIEEKNWITLKKEIAGLEPFQIAEIFESLQAQERVVFFRILPRESAKEIFKHLSHEEQKAAVGSIASNVSQLTELLNDLDPDDRTAFFEELPGEVVQRLMQILSAEEREIAHRLLGYPKESIGRLMTPEYVAVKPYFTVQQTLDHIRKFGQTAETLNVIYIVDNNWKLIDDIQINVILLSSPEQTINEISDHRFVSLNAYDDREVAVKAFQDNMCVALPVTDTDGTLVGIVTVDDVMDVLQQEVTEDFHKFGGTGELDLSYTKTSLLEMIKKRSGWLVILFFGEMLTASAMGYFEDAMAKAVVLALFVPLIISSGGNSGSQAASLIIRSLALGELKLKNWWYVMSKEILSGLVLGAILGTVGFTRIFVWQALGFYNYGEYWVWLGLVIFMSLIFVVLWGTLSGSMIPFILKRAGFDPATASAPFVATLVDVTGLIIYFSVAMMLLSGKLL